MGKEVARKEKIKDLLEGRLPWKEVKDIIRLKPKEPISIFLFFLFPFFRYGRVFPMTSAPAA